MLTDLMPETTSAPRPEEERWLRTTEACAYLSVTRWTLDRYADAGRLHPRRLGTPGGELRWRQSELTALLVADSDPDSAWRGQGPRGPGRRKKPPKTGEAPASVD